MFLLASLDNEVIFKRAFTDKTVFQAFAEDILGVPLQIGTIETEKQFSPKIGNIDFKLDIFAETEDKRIVIELQRVEYDHNFDRFLHYFLALIIEQQRRSKDYGIEQTVYAIIVMTEPYTIEDKSGKPVRNEVLMLHINPQTLSNELINLYGHQFVVLNPNHPDKQTPKKIRDWLDLIYQSIHNPERPVLNENHAGIMRAAELISYDNIPPEEIAAMKNAEAARKTFFLKELKTIEKMVRQMQQEGIPLATIARITDFPQEHIEAIISKP